MREIKNIYENIVGRLLEECRKYYGERLVSFCVFGSAGRGTVHPESDIDFLIVAESLPDGRLKRVQEYLPIEAALKDALTRARQEGVFIELSPAFKTPDEVLQGSLLFLDMIEDGRILFDRDDFFRRYLSEFAERLKAQGARRVHLGDAWYWILKDPYFAGEEIEL